MKEQYQKLMEEIHVPEELNDRVLWAAQKQEKMTENTPKRLVKRNFRPILRTAVCAACALALVLGTVHFYPTSQTGDSTTDAASVALPTLSFGLTAYAADTGETYVPNANGGLAFVHGPDTYWSEQRGCYTGCMFQVTGESIQQVTLSMDRGGLYRWQDGSASDGVRLGDTVTEPYDPDVWYGFWTMGAEPAAWEEDAISASRASIDQLDGVRLAVTVTFVDGSTQSDTYRLSTGWLRATCYEDGSAIFFPQLAGDDEDRSYGVYAVSESESRWFQWPVADCTVIQLSNPYGEVNGVSHPGIDIAASAGSAITAAADGIVAETGFTAQDGNYLILDHGGGLETKYAHCQDIAVSQGDTVSAGETIATVGSTGQSTGSHLCFQVWQDGEAQNPVAYFDSDIRDTLSMQ